MKQKVVFFGAGSYIVPVIETLARESKLSLVVTTETGQNDPLISYLKNMDINYVSIKNFDQSVIGEVKKINARIAVLAYFGLIVPKKALDLFPLGIINVHPSLLPKYRGATPGQTAILNGGTITGVSIIKLDEEVDHGPILAQASEPIELNDTSETLYRKLFKIGAELLSETLPKYISGEIKPVEQKHSKATFTDRLTRESGQIDINKVPNSEQLDRMIRAYYPWPTVWFKTILNGRELLVRLLPEQKIQVEGKNIMNLRDFANGYPEGRLLLEKLSFLAPSLSS